MQRAPSAADSQRVLNRQGGGWVACRQAAKRPAPCRRLHSAAESRRVLDRQAGGWDACRQAALCPAPCRGLHSAADEQRVPNRQASGWNACRRGAHRPAPCRRPWEMVTLRWRRSSTRRDTYSRGMLGSCFMNTFFRPISLRRAVTVRPRGHQLPARRGSCYSRVCCRAQQLSSGVWLQLAAPRPRPPERRAAAPEVACSWSRRSRGTQT